MNQANVFMQINGIDIEDSFAEAFPMTATRLIITAEDVYWARRAAEALTGFATSVIACGCEASIERESVTINHPTVDRDCCVVVCHVR